METKTCSKCDEDKPIDEFNWKSKSRGIRQSACRVCSRLEGKQHYNSNKKKVVMQVNVRNKKYGIENKRWKDQFACAVCDEDYTECLDFHHLDPTTKKFDISSRLPKSCIGHIIKEANKCIVVCSNCHRKIHGGKIKITKSHLRKNSKMLKESYASIHPLASNQLKG